MPEHGHAMKQAVWVLTLGLIFSGGAKSAFSQQLVFNWVVPIGSPNDENMNSVRVDPEGNVYVAGELRGAVDFDPGPGMFILDTNGGEDVFVAKYDRVGNLIWARSFGSTVNDNGTQCAVDAEGAVLLCGAFSETVDFAPDGPGDMRVSSGGADAFLTKRDADGNYLWTQVWGGSDGDRAERVEVAANGDVLVAGHFGSVVDFDPGPGIDEHTSEGGQDWYLTRFDGSGNHLWTIAAGSSSNDTAQGLAVDGLGNAYVGGDYRSTVDFDPGPPVAPHTSVGDRDAFLAKYDSSGNHVWSRSFGGTAHDEPRHVGIDSLGNVYITGEFRDTVDFDPGAEVDSRSSKGEEDAFFSKYDADGNYKFTRTAGGIGVDVGHGVAVDASGTVYFTGGFSDSVDFDPGLGLDEFLSMGNTDGFVSRYDESGAYLGTSTISSTGEDYVRPVAFDGFGNVCLSGGFSAMADLDLTEDVQEYSAVGGRDGFIMQLRVAACGNRGDMNDDGFIDGNDIQLFVNKLLNQ